MTGGAHTVQSVWRLEEPMGKQFSRVLPLEYGVTINAIANARPSSLFCILLSKSSEQHCRFCGSGVMADMSAGMPKEEKPRTNQSAPQPKESKLQRPRNGKPQSVRPHEIMEMCFAGLALILLCIGAWLYLKPQIPTSGQLSDFVPSALAAAMYFFMSAWPSVSSDQGTLVGLSLMIAGAIFWYLGTQPAAANLPQKADLKELGLTLLSGGAGVFVGQRLPRSAKRNDGNDEQV